MEQVQRLQSIEREMLSEGRSSSDIDAFKARLRQESFTGENPQFSGVGALNETARDMNRGPRGLAVYMQEGGDPKTYDAGGRFQFDENVEDPLSVRLLSQALDYTPVGTVKAIDEIYDEYQQEEPDLAKMGIMAAAEVAGYLPLAGPAVKSMVRGPLFPKRTNSLPSGKNYFELIVLGNNKKLNDIAAEFGVTSENLADADFDTLRSILNRAEKRGVMDPRDVFNAKKNLDADEIAMNKEMFSEDVYHFSKGTFKGDTFDPSGGASRFDRLGTHVGTQKAAKDRSKVVLGDMDAKKIFSLPEGAKGGSTMPLRARLDKPYLNSDGEAFSESGLKEAMNNYADQNKIADLDIAMEAFRKDLTDNGFTHIPYVNAIEDKGVVSNIMLTNRTAGDPAVLKGRFSKFEDVNDPRLMRADGGAVMQGVGSLNETARNMSRGPRGIAGYQQFADGGELNVNLRPLDLPVDGRMSYTQTDDGGRFNSEIRKTFEGGLGSLTPSFDYSTQNRSRNMGDVVIDEDGEQIGFALEGELFLKPQSEDKVRGAFAIEKSRNNTNFTFPEGEFVETRDGLLKRFNLGMDLGNFGIDLNRTEASGREPINEGSATIRVGENGIIRYSDSDRGEPNIEFNYRKQFADGGPVYMSKGGGSGEESVRDTILSTIYGIESNNDYNAWNNRAKNPPSQALTSLTVKEIMDYQGNENGPAAGAGQIKYNTLKYLLNTGTLSEDDLFTESVQDAANNKLLDRRGFNSWLNGEIDNLTFGSNIASEWASIPLLFDQTVNGKAKERGDSRYGGSNEALIGADAWENVLYSARARLAPVPAPEEIMLAEAYSPQTLVSEVMAGEPTYMTNVTAGSPEYSGMRPLDRSEYPKEENAFTMFVPEEEENAFTMFVPEEEKEPEALKAGLSLYEKYAPSAVQDALLGIGYLNSVTGPSR